GLTADGHRPGARRSVRGADVYAGHRVLGIREPQPGAVQDLAVPADVLDAEVERGDGAPPPPGERRADLDHGLALDHVPGGLVLEPYAADPIPITGQAEGQDGVAQPRVAVVERAGEPRPVHVPADPRVERVPPDHV